MIINCVYFLKRLASYTKKLEFSLLTHEINVLTNCYLGSKALEWIEHSPKLSWAAVALPMAIAFLTLLFNVKVIVFICFYYIKYDRLSDLNPHYND